MVGYERKNTWAKPLRAPSSNRLTWYSAPKSFWFGLGSLFVGLAYATHYLPRIPGSEQVGGAHTYARRTPGVVGDDWLGPRLPKGVETLRPHIEGQENL